MSRSREPYHHGDLKRALIDAALELVEHEGPEALSFRRLAEAVKVSHAAPLAHFPDRRSLDAAVANRGFEQLETLLQPEPPPRPPQALEQPRFLLASAAAPTPPLATSFAAAAARPSGPSPAGKQLMATALRYLRFALEHPGLYRMMYDPELSHRLEREKAGVTSAFVGLVRDGQVRGELRRELPPEEVARLFTALAEGLARQFIAEKPSSRSGRLLDAERMFGLLVDAVETRSS